MRGVVLGVAAGLCGLSLSARAQPAGDCAAPADTGALALCLRASLAQQQDEMAALEMRLTGQRPIPAILAEQPAWRTDTRARCEAERGEVAEGPAGDALLLDCLQQRTWQRNEDLRRHLE